MKTVPICGNCKHFDPHCAVRGIGYCTINGLNKKIKNGEPMAGMFYSISEICPQHEYKEATHEACN